MSKYLPVNLNIFNSISIFYHYQFFSICRSYLTMWLSSQGLNSLGYLSQSDRHDTTRDQKKLYISHMIIMIMIISGIVNSQNNGMMKEIV